MKSAKQMCVTATAFALLAIPVGSAQGQQENQLQHVRYAVTDLGSLGGGQFSQPSAINNQGQVAGWLATTVNVRAFDWANGRMRNLGALGGHISQATALNERGEVVGNSETSVADPLGEEFCGGQDYNNDQIVCLPFLWRNGMMTPLPILGGNNGMAFGINNRGQMVGTAENAVQDPTCPPPQVLQFKPVLWEKGQIRELPTVLGDPDGFVNAINDNGQAVGNTVDCGYVTVHAALWDNGTATNLGTLGNLTLNPNAINNTGQVVGTAFDPFGSTNVAFLWEKGAATSLGTLPGDVESHASAINDKGQVVGQSCHGSAPENCSAFLWENGVMTDLNTLIPPTSALLLWDAGGINSHGDVVGQFLQISTGNTHAFLATPCDEEHFGLKGCEENHADAIVGVSETSSIPQIVLPENVRNRFQRRTGQHRYPGFGVQPQK
jgi:probable HAF family extracellular repeat protein